MRCSVSVPDVMFLWIQSILSMAQVSVSQQFSVTVELVLHITSVSLLVSCHHYLKSLWNFPFFKGKKTKPVTIAAISLLWDGFVLVTYFICKVELYFPSAPSLFSISFQVVWLCTVVWETLSRYLISTMVKKAVCPLESLLSVPRDGCSVFSWDWSGE